MALAVQGHLCREICRCSWQSGLLSSERCPEGHPWWRLPHPGVMRLRSPRASGLAHLVCWAIVLEVQRQGACINSGMVKVVGGSTSWPRSTQKKIEPLNRGGETRVPNPLWGTPKMTRGPLYASLLSVPPPSHSTRLRPSTHQPWGHHHPNYPNQLSTPRLHWTS